jgi:cytochrome c-type biogenesis protein CcmH/NrfF
MDGKQAQSEAKERDSVAEALVNERARALFREIRCLECGSGQNIEFSNAPVAVALREQIRNMLLDGVDTQTIRDYLTQEYGRSVWFQESSVFWTDPLLRRLLLGGIVLGSAVGVAVLGLRGVVQLPFLSPETLSKSQLRQITRDIQGPTWRWSAAEERTLRMLLSPPGRRVRQPPAWR